MKPERVVEVWALRTDGEWSCGSGYLVAPRLVLTAAHVIVAQDPRRTPFQTAATSDDVRLRTIGRDDLVTARVIWRGSGPGLDVALLEVGDPAWRPGPLRPVRWGRMTCQATRVGCTAVGFPRVLRMPDARREREQLSGAMNPGTGVKSHQYHVMVDNPPAHHMDQDSPWAGMSGAALFTGDLLVGVVIIDHEGFDGSRLTAVRIAEVFRDPDFVAHLRTHGTPAQAHRPPPGTVVRPVLESSELMPLFTQPRPVRRPRSPAALLTADVAAVRWFADRDAQLDPLLGWLADDERLRARLIVGPGGHGKTRLARELVHRAQDDGWITGMVTAQTPDDLQADCLERLSSCEVPLLLVVDYAETRPGVVSRLLERMDPESGSAVRFLLLARSPGQWWEHLWGSSWQLQDAAALDEVEVLGPLPQSEAVRTAAFTEAVTDLAAGLPRVRGLPATDWAAAAGRITVPELGQARYGSMMRVHLAALVGLLQEGPRPKAATSATPHEDVLIHHERIYWEASARNRQLGLSQDTLANAVGVATALGAADRNEALAVLARVKGLDGETENSLMTVDGWLSTLYPSPENGHWGPLEPDRLGEYLVGVQLRDWPGLLDAPLAAATRAQLLRSFHVLARAGVDHGPARELLHAQITTQLRRTGPVALTVAVETEEPAHLLAALEDGIAAASGDAETLGALAEGFPAETPVLLALAERIARLETGVYQRLMAAGHDYRGRLAQATRRHADHLRDLGRTDEADAARNAAIDLFRELTARDERKTEGDAGP
ncbi:trypsin-like peptidase domain-containing protein [Streptomyces fildesensis]|uniref:Trypsin-like peptidase domain-containing protein n=1 Tax=Streptomyces fildesensis TaxID=375757 RepID=A0ABW8C6R9_9ACTN